MVYTSFFKRAGPLFPKPAAFSVLFASSVLFAASLLYADPGAKLIPPIKTLTRMEEAFQLLDSADRYTAYTMTSTFSLSDGGGKLLKTTELVERVTIKPGQKPVRETISRSESGKDVDISSSASKSGNGGSANAYTLAMPTESDRDLFSFTPIKNGAVSSADFSPSKAGAKQLGITRGSLSWDSVSGYPLRLEATPLKNPPFTNKLTVVFEFADYEGRPYPSRIEFNGEIGILFFTRKVTYSSTISALSFNN